MELIPYKILATGKVHLLAAGNPTDHVWRCLCGIKIRPKYANREKSEFSLISNSCTRCAVQAVKELQAYVAAKS